MWQKIKAEDREILLSKATHERLSYLRFLRWMKTLCMRADSKKGLKELTTGLLRAEGRTGLQDLVGVLYGELWEGGGKTHSCWPDQIEGDDIRLPEEHAVTEDRSRRAHARRDRGLLRKTTFFLTRLIRVS